MIITGDEKRANGTDAAASLSGETVGHIGKWTEKIYGRNETDIGSGLVTRETLQYVLISRAELAQTSSGIDDLYRLGEGSAEIARLQRAIELLEGASKHAKLAAAASRELRAIDADNEMQQIQALLPELFCLRTLGDGLGAVVNSLQTAFINLEGIPLDEGQINAVAKALHRLRQTPFLQFDEAVDIILRMEEVGIPVDPPALGALADLSDD